MRHNCSFVSNCVFNAIMFWLCFQALLGKKEKSADKYMVYLNDCEVDEYVMQMLIYIEIRDKRKGCMLCIRIVLQNGGNQCEYLLWKDFVQDVV